MSEDILPVGKLPASMLANLISQIEISDSEVLQGPGIGLDCAIIEIGDDLLVLKSDPITFATDSIGWYAVQVNANDIATTGAVPRWMLTTILLPDNATTSDLVEQIHQDLLEACREIDVTVVGGHTEITQGLSRPLLIGTMIGVTDHAHLVSPRGARPGDRLLLTKSVPIEATAILAREFPETIMKDNNETSSRLKDFDNPPLQPTELEQARHFLKDPGISIVREALMANRSGRVHAMHDPTEGGIYSALWELAVACAHSLSVDFQRVPVPALSRRIFSRVGLDPFGAIASGSLLLAVPPEDSGLVCEAISSEGIPCVEIGEVLERPGRPEVWQINGEGLTLCPWPERDELARLFENRGE